MSRTDPRKGAGSHLNRAGERRGSPVRGVRLDEDLWTAVKAKAEDGGTNRNAAIVALLRGYVSGAIRLPKR